MRIGRLISGLDLAADYTFVSPEAEADLKAKRSGPLTAAELSLLRSISDSVLDGDTGFEKPALTQYEQEAYRRSIKDYLAWQDAQVGAKLTARAEAIFGPGGEADTLAKAQRIVAGAKTNAAIAAMRAGGRGSSVLTKPSTTAIVVLVGIGLLATLFLLPGGKP